MSKQLKPAARFVREHTAFAATENVRVVDDSAKLISGQVERLLTRAAAIAYSPSVILIARLAGLVRSGVVAI